MAHTWNTPKNDFLVTDGLTNSHMNDIGENLATLHSGNGVSSITTGTIASDFNINSTDHIFDTASGTGPILRIRYTDGTISRLPGCIIWIIFNTTSSIDCTGTTSGDYAKITHRNCPGPITILANTVAGFAYYNNAWYVIIP